MTIRLFRLAVIYSLIGIGFGIYMAATHQFQSKAVHVHANLLGWVSLAIMGLIYHVFPAMAEAVLAKVHFWLHNLGLPVTLVGIFMIYNGNPEAGEPLAGIGSSVVALGFVAFAINVWRNAKR